MFSKEQFTAVTPLSKAIAMVVFIVLPFVAFFLGMNYGQQMIRPTELIVIPKTDEVEEIDTSGWQTYTDEEFNISFKYPQDKLVLKYKKGEVPYVFGLAYWVIHRQSDQTYAGWSFEAWNTIEEIEKEFGVKNTDWKTIKVGNQNAEYIQRSPKEYDKEFKEELIVFEGNPTILVWYSPTGPSPNSREEFETSYKSLTR